ncbi:MAG: 23S rRNA (cytosine1962-C5)-methyltransferase [Planctomycetota bacterium]|jgi:23S rRNA (cytosine1962-C5)-methyltransferase
MRSPSAARESEEENTMGKATLTGKGRRWLLKGHPWVYRDDFAEVEGTMGELIPVKDPSGGSMGWGLYSTQSRIAVRMVTRSSEQPNRSFWEARMQSAVDRRQRLGMLDPEGACRLIGGDADGFPGLVIDRYAKTLVVQSGAQGSDAMRDFLLEILKEILPFTPDCIVDRSDTSVRKLEGLEKRVEVLEGTLDGPVLVRDGELQYDVDVTGGHKTGHYLDQSFNRREAAKLGVGGRVLDAFAYDGLFGLHAALAGAEQVVCLEQNKGACERIMKNAERNGLADKIRVEKVDCMKDMRARAETDERYELVIVDPPAFARSKKEVEGAARGYVELNRRAIDLTVPLGSLVSASCSHNVGAEQFIKMIGKAAHGAHRQVWLEELRKASPDHPHLVTLPETDYLKCAFLRIG